MNSTLIGWLVLLWLPRAGPEDLGRKAQKVAYKRVQLSLFLRRNQRDFPLLRHFWPSNFMINALHDFIFFSFFQNLISPLLLTPNLERKTTSTFYYISSKVWSICRYFLFLGSFHTWYVTVFENSQKCRIWI